MIIEKLNRIQTTLIAKKGQFNSFGKYAYRSCEDILESIKPHLQKEGLILTLQDDIVLIGDRFYVKATATLTDGKETVTTTAFAREELEKKGMDGSQVTGAASSYARKYALNGLFAIDDCKDADTNEQREQAMAAPEKEKKPAAKKQKTVQDLQQEMESRPHLTCADCGAFIFDAYGKDGKQIPLDGYEQLCQKFFKRTLCRDCQKKK